MRVRVADMEVKLDKPRHTYVIEYTQEGALRTFDGKPEFYWDVTGVNLPPIAQATVKVTAPGGITEAKCHPAAGTDCSVTTDADGATFSAQHVDGILTVHTGLVPGKVANAKPILKPMPDQRTWDEKLEGFVNEHRLPSFLATGLVSFLMFVWGPLKLLLPRRIKDERFVNAPPGVVVQGGATTTKRLRGTIPVRFIPPEATLVQAGRALNGASRVPRWQPPSCRPRWREPSRSLRSRAACARRKRGLPRRMARGPSTGTLTRQTPPSARRAMLTGRWHAHWTVATRCCSSTPKSRR